jgi:hypothetical protein
MIVCGAGLIQLLNTVFATRRRIKYRQSEAKLKKKQEEVEIGKQRLAEISKNLAQLEGAYVPAPSVVRLVVGCLISRGCCVQFQDQRSREGPS